MNRKDLVGIWSVDILYLPGVSDERVIFSEGGKGWFEYLNWDVLQIETFRWWISDNGTLNIKGSKIYSMFEPVIEESDYEETGITYEIIDVITPSKVNTKKIIFSKHICLFNDEFGLKDEVVSENYLDERLMIIKEGYKEV